MAQDQAQTGQRGGTKETNPGNFANDRERASRAGQKEGRLLAAILPMTANGHRKRAAKGGKIATGAAAASD